ncbi:MAG: HPF/RaiA family ribosome-associated protein [Labilithrix sp.]|nr:HPF/RaiA family ribosome-associated protein [Labilithrix sp.]
MPVPVQLTFRDISPSAAVSAHVAKRAAKLETFFDRIIRCHVVVEQPHRHQKHGQRYHVRVDVSVPGHLLVVSKNPEAAKEDLHAAVDDAFGDAERLVEDYARQLRPWDRNHAKPPWATVAKLFPERGYGFLVDDEGREIYFHENSVIGARFDKLSVGAKVRFAEEDGDKGPQASSVHVVAS